MDPEQGFHVPWAAISVQHGLAEGNARDLGPKFVSQRTFDSKIRLSRIDTAALGHSFGLNSQQR